MRIQRLLALTLALAQGLGIGAAWANPLDGIVVAGNATFNRNGNVLTIVNAPGTIINWGSFNIAGNETTRFVQQGPSSAVLNRIVGQDPSMILGALQSNGHVFLVNPNGVVFGAGARVDVNGLIASSLDISNDDFRAGHLNFAAGSASPGAVRNDGAITTPSGGRVYLIAPSVENSGLISSPQGDVVLAAGRQVQLVDSRNPDLHVVASAPADSALNLGRIISAGGSVGIYGALVNQRGVIDADSAVVGENGRIVLRASDTTLLEAGSSTTARGAGTGGDIHLLGDHVGLTDDASVDASGRTGGGSVLVTASAAYLGANTSIRADALDFGDGGRVIVHATGATRAYGQISARGGANSGNGGFAEISGASYLDYHARADLRAAHGTAGTLLLDPNDITIQAAGTTDTVASGAPVTFAGGPASSILTVADLISQLGMGNVTVSTSGGTGGPLGGHITVASAVAWTGGTLTLDADNGIAINGAITNPADGRLILVNRGGTITQTAPIGTTYLVINSLGDVFLDSAANTVSLIAAQIGDGANLNHNFRFLNSGPLMVGSLSGVNGISVATSGAYSSAAPDGVISLRTTSGDITQAGGATIIGKAINVEADNVTLNEANAGVVSGALTGGAASNTFSFTTGGNLTVGDVAGRSGIQAGNGDVSLTSIDGTISGTVNAATVSASAANGISLTTQTQSIAVTNSGGSGGINITNTGALTVAGATDSGTGPISISASGPLTISGAVSSTAGAITLAAGPTGSTTDVLTINGSVAAAAGNGVVVSTTGPILLRAGDAINVTGTVAGAVTQQPNLNTPVLPTLAQCIANPTLAGCSAVLPTLAQCTATPTLAGCSVVLPTLAQCTATPTLAGCSVILPTVTQCTVTPTLAGCSVVLPSLAQCVANPALAGCSAILPSLAQCAANPSTGGCSAVLPTLGQCIASPTFTGCSAILPTIAQCVASPALAGCSVVLPTLTQCTSTPTLAGCSSVLPTLTQCTSSPTLAGCSVVLPTLTQCTASPSSPGCSVILPPLATCVAAPTTAGCQVVLPPLSQCIAAPTQPGCQAVLPTIAQCVAAPSAAGCSVVLPTLGSCTATPALPGCQIVLPSVSQCTSTPTLAGCSAVLPTLSTCVTTPTVAGCQVVLPTLNSCLSTPTAAGCAVVLPPVVQTTTPPTSQVLNSTVNLINTVTTTNPASALPITTNTGTAGTTGTKPADTTADKKDDKKDVAVDDKPGVKNEPTKKLYCN